VPFDMQVNMSTNRGIPFVHQVHPGNNAITESHCPQCGILVAGGTADKYLAIAEAVHKCRMISAPRITQEDLSRLY
jgi:hypothetical protein